MENTSFAESLNAIVGAPQVPSAEPEKAEKKNILFDIINALFINKDIVSNITYESAKQNIFMINRRMAIKYPMQAQVFNFAGLNPKDVIMSWSDFVFCGNVPRWIYTPGAAKTKNQTTKDLIRQDSVVRKFMAYYGIGRREMDSCIRLFPAETEEELKAFVKFQKELEKNEEAGK